MLLSKATVSGAPGTYTVDLRFSGEEIFRSGEDGPYDLSLLAIGAADNDQLTVPTPAYTHTRFGEVGAAITGASDAAIDDDSDGDFDAVETTVNVEVRVPGTYRLQGALSVAGGGETLATAGGAFTMGAGAHALTLRFALPESEHVHLVVYNMQGQEVAHLVDQTLHAGMHAVTWNATGLASGVYIYRLVAGPIVETRQMVLLK